MRRDSDLSLDPVRLPSLAHEKRSLQAESFVEWMDSAADESLIEQLSQSTNLPS